MILIELLKLNEDYIYNIGGMKNGKDLCNP